MMLSNIKRNNPGVMRMYRNLTMLIPDKKFLSWQFKRQLGYEMDWDNPSTFNQKLQWLKMHWHDPLATKCADKYEVREYVTDKIGENILNELFAVYDKPDQIDLQQLPNSFVLKATHSSSMNIICQNKNQMNWEENYDLMNHWLRTNYYRGTREWVYKDIKPRIICEKLLEDEKEGGLNDYKFFCFNGEPKFIQVDVGRFSDHRKNLYDLNWDILPFTHNFPNYPGEIEEPKTLDKMIQFAKLLSGDFPFVRVDFYSIGEKVYFGELTFFPAAGFGRFKPNKYDEILGSKLVLP